MLTSNLIFTILALAIPQTFAAPIPAASSTSVSKSAQGAEKAVDATSHAITAPQGAGVVNPVTSESNAVSEASPKSSSKSVSSTGKNKSKVYKHKNKHNKGHKSHKHKALKGLKAYKHKHKHHKNKSHKSQKALQSQKIHTSANSTETQAAQTLVRRATPAQVGSEITLNGVKFKLESAVGHHAHTAVFHTKYNGVSAYAKQNINDSGFAKEMENTKKASDALKTGLYLASGTAGGSQWLVTKSQPGKTFRELLLAGKLKDRASAVTKATTTVLGAQKTLANGAKFVQADTNTENWLFSDDLSHVYPIDLGITQAVNGWSAQVESGQKKEWEDMFGMTYDHFKTPSKSASSAKKSSKSPRSVRSP